MGTNETNPLKNDTPETSGTNGQANQNTPVAKRSVKWQAHHPSHVEVIGKSTDKTANVELIDLDGRHLTVPEAFRLAKTQGDVAAAEAYVNYMIEKNPEALENLIKNYGAEKPVLIPVIAKELSKDGKYNAIPDLYALIISEKTGWAIQGDNGQEYIRQTNKAGRTGASALDRMVAHANFSGKVEPGQNYILVDDHFTNGGTMRDLMEFVENEGAHVVGISTLINGRRDDHFKPIGGAYRKLVQNLGIEEFSKIHEKLYSTPCKHLEDCMMTAGEINQMNTIVKEIEDDLKTQYTVGKNKDSKIIREKTYEGLERRIDQSIEKRNQTQEGSNGVERNTTTGSDKSEQEGQKGFQGPDNQAERLETKIITPAQTNSQLNPAIEINPAPEITVTNINASSGNSAAAIDKKIFVAEINGTPLHPAETKTTIHTEAPTTIISPADNAGNSNITTNTTTNTNPAPLEPTAEAGITSVTPEVPVTNFRALSGFANSGIGIGMGSYGLYTKLTGQTYSQDINAGGEQAFNAKAAATSDGVNIGLGVAQLGITAKTVQIASQGAAAELQDLVVLSKCSKVLKGLGPLTIGVSLTAGYFDAKAADAAGDGHRLASSVGGTLGGTTAAIAATGLGEAGTVLTCTLAGSEVPIIGNIAGAVVGLTIVGLSAYFGSKAGSAAADGLAGDALQKKYDDETKTKIAQTLKGVNAIGDKIKHNQDLADHYEKAEEAYKNAIKGNSVKEIEEAKKAYNTALTGLSSYEKFSESETKTLSDTKLVLENEMKRRNNLQNHDKNWAELTDKINASLNATNVMIAYTDYANKGELVSSKAILHDVAETQKMPAQLTKIANHRKLELYQEVATTDYNYAINKWNNLTKDENQPLVTSLSALGTLNTGLAKNISDGTLKPEDIKKAEEELSGSVGGRSQDLAAVAEYKKQFEKFKENYENRCKKDSYYAKLAKENPLAFDQVITNLDNLEKELQTLQLAKNIAEAKAKLDEQNVKTSGDKTTGQNMDLKDAKEIKDVIKTFAAHDIKMDEPAKSTALYNKEKLTENTLA